MGNQVAHAIHGEAREIAMQAVDAALAVFPRTAKIAAARAAARAGGRAGAPDRGDHQIAFAQAANGRTHLHDFSQRFVAQGEEFPARRRVAEGEARQFAVRTADAHFPHPEQHVFRAG